MKRDPTDYLFVNALREVLGLEPLTANGAPHRYRPDAPAARRPQDWRIALRARRAALLAGLAGAGMIMLLSPTPQTCISAGRGPAPSCGFGRVAVCIQPDQDPYSAIWVCVAR